MAIEGHPRSRFVKRLENRNKSVDSSQISSSPTNDASCWCPRPSVVFNVLLSARISAAFLSNISDCDETFNYWEPTHYLMYGTGFQTWEYSPKYAIRSYGYIMLHVLPAKLVKSIFLANKVTVFYYVRFLFAILCAACETYFYKAVWHQFGSHVARLLFVFLAFNTGMFIAAAAYLPSSFAMYACLLAFGGWFNRNHPVAIFGIAVGSLVGWPFCAVLGVPIAYDIVVRQHRFWSFLQWAVGIFLAIMIPLIAADTHYYGKQVIAPLNIVLYNVFGQGGPDLYGVEPWTFYFKNCFLNFNIVSFLAFASLPICMFVEFKMKASSGIFKLPLWLVLSPLYIWIVIFFTRPHKEERFLFPVYPYFCLAAALTLAKFQELFNHYVKPSSKRHYSESSWLMAGVLLLSYVAISMSRSSALFVGYHGPLEVYPELHNLVTPTDPERVPIYKEGLPINVCVGKEWYRFPGSFFLPDNWQLRFIKSEFRGQLPQRYKEGADGTKIIPENMNEMNQEETSRYSPIEICDLLVDLDLPVYTELEPNYSNMAKQWQIIHSKRFLDPSRSHWFFRAYYIPWISERYTTFSSYNLLKSKRKTKRRPRRVQVDED